jgi:hypothetical protein
MTGAICRPVAGCTACPMPTPAAHGNSIATIAQQSFRILLA